MDSRGLRRVVSPRLHSRPLTHTRSPQESHSSTSSRRDNRRISRLLCIPIGTRVGWDDLRRFSSVTPHASAFSLPLPDSLLRPPIAPATSHRCSCSAPPAPATHFLQHELLAIDMPVAAASCSRRHSRPDIQLPLRRCWVDRLTQSSRWQQQHPTPHFRRCIFAFFALKELRPALHSGSWLLGRPQPLPQLRTLRLKWPDKFISAQLSELGGVPQQTTQSLRPHPVYAQSDAASLLLLRLPAAHSAAREMDFDDALRDLQSATSCLRCLTLERSPTSLASPIDRLQPLPLSHAAATHSPSIIGHRAAHSSPPTPIDGVAAGGTSDRDLPPRWLAALPALAPLPVALAGGSND